MSDGGNLRQLAQKRKRGRPRSELLAVLMGPGVDMTRRTAQRALRWRRLVSEQDADRIDKIVLSDRPRGQQQLVTGMIEKLALLPPKYRDIALTTIEGGWAPRDAYDQAVACVLKDVAEENHDDRPE